MTKVCDITSLTQLRSLTGDHPVVIYDVGDGFQAPGFATGALPEGAVVFARLSDRGDAGAVMLGSPDGIAALVASEQVRTWLTDIGTRYIGAPRDRFEPLRALPISDRGGEWDWMWTTTTPPLLPAETRVEALDVAAADELQSFLAAANPRSHGDPFARADQVWIGIREGGRLVAAGCSEPAMSGVPSLAGIAVAPGRRGAGLGAAVTAWLTRDALARSGACTLGLYADNHVARSLYERLGYRLGMQWRTVWLNLG